MTTTQAAAALGIHRSRVLHYIREGRINATQNGFKWEIAPEEVERFRATMQPRGWKPGRSRKSADE